MKKSNMLLPTDQKQRELALNPAASFIVQAPAGSGKTELLVQRFLTLLTVVKQPEEIIALTFTRKAANEMRLRVLEALQNATANIANRNSHEEKTSQLAKAALSQNEKFKWNLLKNPNRLQISTIDSLCANLTRQMPTLSHFGAQPDITEEPKKYYLKAARKLLASLETAAPWAYELKELLLHLDNNHILVEQLFVTMLANREQWLPHILAAKDQQELRQSLEQGLQNIIEENLNKAYQDFPKNLQKELVELIYYAANNLINTNKSSSITNSCNLTEFPLPSLNNFQHWITIAKFLLLDGKEAVWRKQVDVRLGFPVTDKNMKQRMQNLLAELQSYASLPQTLKNIKESPAPNYNDDQWQIVKALVKLLPILAAELTLIFRQHAKVDFIEISSSAIRALGESSLPSDLALSLDYKIQHILVDEFQDTSLMQYKLLELLTAGWQVNDGHTLFLVGDPMQSIYRFRQAEVGLFLRAKNFGISNIKLKPINLSVNFRSSVNIIAWLNETFRKLFPLQEDISSGAVLYNPTVASSCSNELSQVNIVPFINGNATEQANFISNIIHGIKKNNPGENIAILVRSRTHLAEIIPVLKAAGLKFRGVKVEKLSELSIVQDLSALTRALLHLADNIAWLAILRAPWCGLTLEDLYLLANKNKNHVLWEAIKNYRNITELTNDAQKRLARIVPILNYALVNRQRQNLRQTVEYTWRVLGGPACCLNENEIACAQTYFKLLDNPLIDDDIEDLVWLEEKLQTIFAPFDNLSDDKLQIMTIHNAKGLEFDHVILPCLERKTTIDENRLLMWLERPHQQSGSDLILAPIKSNFAEQDTIYQYLRLQESQKEEYENIRLLYVAMTRAKKSLHLLGNVKYDSSSQQLSKPNRASFLSLLWPVIENHFLEKITSYKNPLNENSMDIFPQTIKRLKENWLSPLITDENSLAINQPFATNPLFTIEQHNSTYQIIGMMVHQILQKISHDGWQIWNTTKIQSQKNYWYIQLLQTGIGKQNIDEAINTIELAVTQTLTDERGQWLLTSHPAAQSEWSLTMSENNQIIHLRMDRTFIFDNQRWIIDFKIGQPNHNETLESFLLTQKELHWQQLHLYAQALNKLQKLPIRGGLYFPLCRGWIELDNLV